MQVKVNNKWYYITDFDSYNEVLDLGEIEETEGIPDGLDLEKDWDALQEYIGLSDDEQDIVLAYYRVTNVFNPEEAMEAYIGQYATPADFCQELCEEIDSEELEALPNYLRYCIKWADVWEHYLQHDYFEYRGYYFRNV